MVQTVHIQNNMKELVLEMHFYQKAPVVVEEEAYIQLINSMGNHPLVHLV